ncbi:hypothetical protein SAMN02745146_1583 [Hymenobacter daecheongensis DSM 21074]|uniref:Dolichyl-phosphate-mannose-protein mannosyltransferase n=1 Tax=Hymenobacter daecheongensis DSM 21074 TaxID=1121955 RepID=A0A1M6E721_9BACT|nr:hypothetical protein [Hymenobacter daecheongensis]SHI81272.1 hypothetical protein SAMN02745146_1583 [Hymenobacter daecheongensis DSM 21074]
MTSPKLLRVVLLPALLLGLAGFALGCYYETNDDAAITLLLRGVTAAAPVTDLHLYFHGLAALLALLYAHVPAVPWYAVLLYALLYAAAVLVFAVLDRLLRPHLAPGALVGALVLFFGVAWLEHALWFNYVRVPILLAGGGLLFAAQRAERRAALLLGLLAISLAFLIRPSAALLGLLAAAPGALWLARRRALVLLAVVVLVLGAAQLTLTFTRTPAQTTYRALDVLKSNLNDFHLYQTRPRTAPDSLGIRAVQLWALGDSALVNEGLFQRTAYFSGGTFVREQVPAKLAALFSQLARDYFPLLLLNLALYLEVLRNPRRYEGRRRFWLAQAGYLLLIFGLGLGLKFPPRLGLPVVGLWVLSTLSYVLSVPRRPVRLTPLSTLALLLIGALYGFKTGHRVQVLRREQGQNVARLHQLQRAAVEPVWVVAGLETLFKSWSPFQEPSFAPRSVLSLTGWITLDPSQPALRQHLTGTRSLPAALRRLADRPHVDWLLTLEAASWLRTYLRVSSPAGQPAITIRAAGSLPEPDAALPQRYRVRTELAE